jgi:signal peptidase I
VADPGRIPARPRLSGAAGLCILVSMTREPSLPRPVRRLPQVAFAAAAILAFSASALGAPRAGLVRILATGSMRPLVEHTLILPLDPIPYRDLRIGEVAVYRHDRTGLVVAHRIVARQFDWFVMKGDSNRADDTGFMTRANYLGVVHLPGDYAGAAAVRRGRDADRGSS